MLPEELQHKTGPGRKLKTSEFNALVDGVQRVVDPAVGSRDSAAVAVGNMLRGIAPLINGQQLAEAAEIPAFSVFGVVPNASPTNNAVPLMVNIAPVGTGSDHGSNLLLFTNENCKIIKKGQVRPIGMYLPSRLRISSSGDPPEEGKECGPSTTDDCAVNKAGKGLFCLAIEPNEDYCWVYALAKGGGGGRRWLVKPTSGDILAGFSGTVRVWSGPGGSETENDPPEEHEPFNRTDSTIPDNEFAEMVEMEDGELYIVPWTCDIP